MCAAFTPASDDVFVSQNRLSQSCPPDKRFDFEADSAPEACSRPMVDGRARSFTFNEVKRRAVVALCCCEDDSTLRLQLAACGMGAPVVCSMSRDHSVAGSFVREPSESPSPRAGMP